LKQIRQIITILLCVALASTALNAAGSVNYTALGDSIAFGAFAPIGKGYVPLYAQYYRNDNATFVQLLNLGVPGWTSYDLANALRTNFLFQLPVFSSGVITLNIGGNDLTPARNSYKAGTCGGATNTDCLQKAVDSFKSNWDSILSSVLFLRRFRPTVLRTMDIYNPFVNIDKNTDSWLADGGANDFEALKPFLDDVNFYITSTSNAKGILVAPVYKNFNGASGDEDAGAKGLLAFDSFHPNAQGHALIAKLLQDLGYTKITP
jgi:lysophospholipase L1-like esterase